MKARFFMLLNIRSAQSRGPDLFPAWGEKTGRIRAGFPADVLKVGSSLKRTLSSKEVAFEGVGYKGLVLGIRGGSWNNASSNLRVSDRNNAGNTNADRNNNIGFRPARTTSPVAPDFQDSVFGKQKTEGRGHGAESIGHGAEGRGRKAEDRRQKTEDRRQKTEGGDEDM